MYGYNAIATLEDGTNVTRYAGEFETLRDAEDYVFRCMRKHDNIVRVLVECVKETA